MTATTTDGFALTEDAVRHSVRMLQRLGMTREDAVGTFTGIPPVERRPGSLTDVEVTRIVAEEWAADSDARPECEPGPDSPEMPNTETSLPPTREALAHHEAGHAVVRVVLAHSVRYVTIRATSLDALGRVHVGNRRRMIDGFDAALFTLAGPLAELVHLGYAEAEAEGHLDEFEHWDIVMGAYLGFMDNLGFPEIAEAEHMWPLRTVEDLGGSALDLVGKLWPQITTVAGALLASPRALTGPQVYRLVGGDSFLAARKVLRAAVDATDSDNTWIWSR